MGQLPTISNYGRYSSDNYGANSLRVDIGALTLYYSYETIVAFQSRGEFKIRENDWSVTTGKHLNWIDEDKSKRITGTEFEELLQKELEFYGLWEEENCKYCGKSLYGRVRVHHHTEKGVDVTTTL